jgi:hypothetical protein
MDPQKSFSYTTEGTETTERFFSLQAVTSVHPKGISFRASLCALWLIYSCYDFLKGYQL